MKLIGKDRNKKYIGQTKISILMRLKEIRQSRKSIVAKYIIRETSVNLGMSTIADNLKVFY